MSTIARDNLNATAKQISPTVTEYPFSELGDNSTRLHRRRYKATSYTPLTIGSATDPDDASARLIAEGPPQRTPSGAWEWVRVYADVPGDQVEYSSQVLARPDFSAYSPVNLSLYATAAAPVSTGSCTYFTRSGIFIHSLISSAIYGARKTSTSANSGSNTRVNCTGHGIGAGEKVIVYYPQPVGAVYIELTAAEITVVDANTFDILGVNWAGTVTQVFPFLANYSPGADRVRSKRTTSFYLPGVTVGITTPDDIPIVSPAFDDDVFVELVLSGASGYQIYDAEPLRRWLDGPIYQQTKIEIDLDSL